MMTMTSTRTPNTTAPWGWAALGALAGLLAAVVVFAPARWLARAVDLGSDEQVRLLDARGSLWQGSARLVLTGGVGSQSAAALPDRLAWRIRPAWDGLRIQLTADCCTALPLHITLAPAGLRNLRLDVADGQSRWPASLLGGLGTPWNTVLPQGQLDLSTQGLAVHWTDGRLRLSGRLQVDARRLSSRLSTLRPLGSYRLTLQGGDAAAFELATLEGSLQLSGRGLWNGQKLRFEGAASAAPERVEALANLLNILGRRDGARSLINLG